MAELYLRRTGAGFLPETEADGARVKKFKPGEVVKAKISKPRNYENHKRLFALLQFIAATSELYDTVEKALTALKILTGHCEFVPHPKTGELVAVPKSISYEAMDEVEFGEWFESAINATLKHLTPQMNRIAIDQAIEQVAHW